MIYLPAAAKPLELNVELVFKPLRGRQVCPMLTRCIPTKATKQEEISEQSQGYNSVETQRALNSQPQMRARVA